MKAVPAQFTASGFVHEMVERQGDLAIYKRSKPAISVPHFEVVRIRRHNGFVIPGTETRTPPAEYYPSPEKWGTDAFTCPTLERAVEKLKEMTKP